MNIRCVAVSMAMVVATGAGTVLSARELSFEERVEAQEAIERVHYSHQIGATQPFEEAVPRSVLEAKVNRYLRRSAEFEARRREPITEAMLERERARIDAGTRLPERLREIYAALGDDPVLIAETVARPALVEDAARDFPRAALDDPCLGNNAWENASLDDGPHPRQFHTVVWTGSVMIVWGGNSGSKTGARYDPATDTWTATATDGAPDGRFDHTAVWTGSRMIVWGGRSPREFANAPAVQTGGRYDPIADAWTSMSTVGAPAPRLEHTAVWTGSRMIVWGGTDFSTQAFANGGSYDPGTDTWAAVGATGAPAGRSRHAALWTGSRMIVWGGTSTGSSGLDTGGLYDPSAGTWVPMTGVNAPAGRSGPVAVWTGSKMIVWGGRTYVPDAAYDTGGVYDPVANAWTATAVSGAPSPRWRHAGIWTGTRLIVWGGVNSSETVPLSDGASYDPDGGSWTPLTAIEAPLARSLHTAVWTGSHMIVWGGRTADLNANNTGGRYDPATETWTPTSIGAVGTPPPGSSTVGVWTGALALIWGVGDGSEGARYDPVLDTWSPMSITGAPAPRWGARTVWTGSEMIVWGGSLSTGGLSNTGARYDPVADAWTPTTTAGAPVARANHTLVWTGSRMIVFGGYKTGAYCTSDIYLNGGAKYDPATDTWEAMSALPGSGRESHVAVWTGSRMLVWGGHRVDLVSPEPPTCMDSFLSSGGSYDPMTDLWTPTTVTGAPFGRRGASAVWTGTEMVVWGGSDFNGFNTGGRYNPTTGTWRPTSLVGAPSPRVGNGAVWTGTKLVVWGGGGNVERDTFTGGIYDPGTDLWIATRTTGAPAERSPHVQLWTGSEVFVWGGRLSTANVGSGGRLQFGRADADADGVADSCDTCPNDPGNDADADGFCANVDNCPFVANAAQANADGDLLGDACDSCPLDAANDADQDGRCANVDNCPTVSNQLQEDIDGDFVGDWCDNCRFVSNPTQFDPDGDGDGEACDNCPGLANGSQWDSDADGAGDACDCQPIDGTDRRPAEVNPLTVGKTGTVANLSWGTVANLDAYAITRGDLASKAASQYGSCLANDLASPAYDDAAVPAAGQGFFYLAFAQNYDCGPGSLGTTSSGHQRTNANAGACGAVVVNDAHASGEAAVFGTVSGTVASTQSSNDDYEVITEVLSTGGSPASRFSRLEHRWTIAVGAGAKKELHVEGTALSSQDGDEFRFEYSTNGVSFTPVTLTVPLGDYDSDLVAPLPGTLTGTVTIRVVDTDRTAGHQYIDAVYVDDLWIRAVP